MIIRNKILLLIILLSLSFCEDNTSDLYQDEKLEIALNNAEEFESLLSLLISRNGKLVVEEYYNGYSQDSLHDVRSVTKSITSILVGIAIDKGFIESEKDYISKYLKPIVDIWESDKDSITIEHLLTMTGGFLWTPIGDWSDYSKWYNASDQIDFVMRRPILENPGEVFNYNDGASHLLSVIVSEASQMSTSDFADKYLFGPLGIDTRPWDMDNRGYQKGNVALSLQSMDMIKIGKLYLNHGKWKNERIISSSWIENSTRKHIDTFSGYFGRGYGYLWWIDEKDGMEYYFANGYGGQFIVVVPDLDMVITATNNWRIPENKANSNWYETASLIIDQIIPSVK